MNRTLAFLCALTLLATPAIARAEALATAPAASKSGVGIAAVVNEDIITLSDINNRMGLFLLGSQGTPPENVRKEIEEKTLAKLIDEKLELQEAKSLGIAVTEDQVQSGFANVAEQNHLPADEFKKRLMESGLKVDTLYDQIRAEIAWSQVARRKLRPDINISESEIDNEITARKNAPPAPPPAPAPEAGAPPSDTGPLVHLKQLVIMFDPKDPENIVNAKIERAISLKGEIKNCADMDKKMKEFVSHGTSDLGTGPLNRLPPPLKKAVEDLKVGELSKPVRGQNGVAVLMVCERQENPSAAAAAAAAAQPAPEPAKPMTPEQQRDDVANMLGMKRLTQMQERYLRDLRATAFIDKRI